QVRTFDIAQGTNRFLLVSFIQLPRPLVGFKLKVNGFDLFGLHSCLERTTPDRFQQSPVSVLGFLIGNGEQQTRSQTGDVVCLPAAAQVAQVIANLVRYAERFAVVRQRVRDFFMSFASGVNGAEAKRDFKRGGRFLAKNVEHLRLREGLRRARPAEFGALAATKLLLTLRGN